MWTGPGEDIWIGGATITNIDVESTEEFHSRSLTEPNVILSHHPARVIQPLPGRGVANARRASGFAAPSG